MDDIEALTKLANMASESGEEFSQEDLAAAQEKMKLILDQAKRGNMPGVAVPFFVYLIGFIVIFGSVGFFGYKLYNSLYEKERKREEKRKLKESRKKK